jgi:hypothetical protein
VPGNNEGKRGRPREYDWPAIAAETAWKVLKSRTKTDTEIVEELLTECRARGEKDPPISDLHKFVSAMRRRLKPR